jgi:branched-chain amino acid aminotransferase
LKGLGRTYALIAHFEAEEAGADDALLLSADGWVAEGPTWNVFWRIGATVFTPSLEAGILEGVTRGLMIELAVPPGSGSRRDFTRRPNWTEPTKFLLL